MVILNDNLTSQLQAKNGFSSPIITKEANNNEITNFSRETNQMNETPIQSFYSGQCVFITGGTGFLGKIFIEKLLRSCRNVEKIYILIRTKKEKNIDERMQDMFADSVFNLLREEFPKFHHKVFPIAGDCCLPCLGISATDREILIRDVSIVFHVAATVRFDEKLKLASAINVRSTADMIELCKSMQKLKSFIYVSTAYSNCHERKITEDFYNYSIKHDSVLKVLDCLPDNIIDDITPRLIQSWPNTYTFSKAITEDLIREKNKGLPMGIFRPGIVISTVKEPVPGWIDNLYGPTGVLIGSISGLLRTVLGNTKVNSNIVPVDYTVNALIASAWDVANQTNRRDEEMLIYNYVSNVDAPITWGEFRNLNLMLARKYPVNNSVWYTTFLILRNKYISNLSIMVLHLLPTLLIDTIYRCIGRKSRLWDTYKKIHKLCNVLSPFTLNEWTFSNDNTRRLWTRLSPRDRQLYQFSLEGFDWEKYMENYLIGIRTYLLKQDMASLEQSRTRFKRLYVLHLITKTLVITLGFWFLWNIITRFI